MARLLLVLLLLLASPTQSESRPQKRTEQLINQLSHYELVIPTLVDHKGDFLSYDLQTRQVTATRYERAAITENRNHRRKLGSGNEKVFYKLSAYGKEFHFKLTLNTGLLSGEFSVEYWDKSGVISRHKSAKKCHFVGYSRHPYPSQAALSNCHGLQGVFTTADDDYFVEPLWNHTNNVNVQGYPHIVYKRSALKFPTDAAHCGVEDSIHHRLKWFSKKFVRVSSKSLKPSSNTALNNYGSWGSEALRQRRSVSREQNVETLVVADKMMLNYHGQHEIEPYVLTILNIVAKLYHNPTIGNSVNIIVTRLVLLTDKQPNLVINHHADKSLGSFCRWQKTINSPENNNKSRNLGIAHHDNAVLLTRYDICTYKNKPCATLGLAPVSGMCEGDRSCSINEDIGLASAYTIAHEIGHNFGMQHDGAGNLCGTPGHEPAMIMAAHLSKNTIPFLWSTCSREYITNFLDSRRGYCLENAPSEKDFEFPRKLPGQIHDANEQCKLQFRSKSEACKPEELCRELWCINLNGTCVTNNIPAADGTECQLDTANKGWCYRGHCEKLSYEPRSVDGDWSDWTGWGNCSRTCDGGVESSERHCNSPVPKNGGKYCIGERRKYRSCNIQDCPKNSTNFRKIQCASYDSVPFRGRFYKWKPFAGSHTKPCSLNCLADGYNFYTERAPNVIDGTRCFPDRLDMCINGKCWHVGCDRILGSPAAEDECRVCGGNGSTCKKISGYQEVMRIPVGAMNVRVAEIIASKNYLALKNEAGVYYINGDWTIDWPRKFSVAGTTVHYLRFGDEPEYFKALGPINENLVVMLLLQEKNRGIFYEYTTPYNLNNSSYDISKYTWKHSNWSECSKTCGKGISISEALCVEEDLKTVVSASFCSLQPRPGELSQFCNKKPCPPKWSFGNWSICSRSCGGGIKTRVIICIEEIDDEEKVVLHDSECDLPRVVSEAMCGEGKCPPQWITDEWSKCVPACGRGKKTRKIYCLSGDGERYLKHKACDAKTKPPSHIKCINPKCPKAQWMTGEWSECSETCSEGKQTRVVQCQNHRGKRSNACDPKEKPPVQQNCTTFCNEDGDGQQEEEEEECVDKYRVAYCPLVVQFRFCKREYFRRLCCKTCLEAEDSS